MKFIVTLEALRNFQNFEEPPEHVYFIFFYQSGEIPETVLSRLTIVNFSRATEEEIMTSLGRVVKGEGLKLIHAALALLAKAQMQFSRCAQNFIPALFAEGKKISWSSQKTYWPWLLFSPRN
jgi:DNA polymerase III gamma/tau subunit